MTDTQDSFLATGGQDVIGFSTESPFNGFNAGVYGSSSPFNQAFGTRAPGLALEQRGVGVIGISEEFDDEGGLANGAGIGVEGITNEGIGVVGVSTSRHPSPETAQKPPHGPHPLAPGVGVQGMSSGVGVHGFSGAEYALPADASQDGVGVLGQGSSAGVIGYGGPDGVLGDGGTGVRGRSWVEGAGVIGVSLDSDLDRGVTGPEDASGGGDGVVGGTGTGSGVSGFSKSGPGVSGTSQSDRGAVFSGGAAAIRLIPSPITGPPLEPGETGDLVVDQAGLIWFCQGPGTWRQLMFA
jgi:hypothetical protein